MHSDPSSSPLTRALSHEWVVNVPMPVRLALGPGGEVVSVIPAGMPALDQLSAPSCRRCGAEDFESMCPGEVQLPWRQRVE